MKNKSDTNKDIFKLYTKYNKKIKKKDSNLNKATLKNFLIKTIFTLNILSTNIFDTLILEKNCLYLATVLAIFFE